MVHQAGNRWVLPKAGKAQIVNGNLSYTENPSGLKLSYKAKDGSFKGSFSAYAIVNGRLKKTKVDVFGVLIDDVGYGMAVIKNVGSWPVYVGYLD